MESLLLFVGRVAGIGGALVCALAAILRVTGRYTLGNFQVGTLLQAGIALSVIGCVALALVVVERTGHGR